MRVGLLITAVVGGTLLSPVSPAGGPEPQEVKGLRAVGALPRQLPADPREWPVVPEWARLGIVGHPTERRQIEPGPMSADSSACPAIAEFSLTSQTIALYFDTIRGVTQIFVGDYSNDRIVRHDVDTALNHTEVPLPLTYGVPLLAVDLDLDGKFELLVQRGGGGNGYLDIRSAPNWVLRQSYVLPGMNVEMSPIAVDLDGDLYPEVCTNPSGFGIGPVVIIKYIAADDSFQVIGQVNPPFGATGRAAAADFDSDGRIEMVWGNEEGYGLLEWRDSALAYVGQIDTAHLGNFDAVACRPKPGGVVHVLLGNSYFADLGFRYQLLTPTGDNTFRIVGEFLEMTGGTGLARCFAADTDCDGLDELALHFYSVIETREWDTTTQGFASICTWNTEVYGSPNEYRTIDLDQNRAPEFGVTVNNNPVFRALRSWDCAKCDSAGRCSMPPPVCFCACHADPACDGVSDVLDVVAAVDGAFRSAPEQPDPGPLCSIRQSDVDCSGYTDVLDVVDVINVVFRAYDPGTVFCDPCATVNPNGMHAR